jgi:2-methylcitrate dehydratase PrpD
MSAEARPSATSAPLAQAGATQTLARYLAAAGSADLPQAVRKEAHRGLLNWVGCTLGGARHEAARFAFTALSPFAGPAQASLLGRAERTDAPLAALINGIASHVLDFDDTHLATVIHPMGPVASAALALAEARGGVSGAEFVTALVLGVEAECRVGLSVFPEHYDRGWHITGTAGVFGAAAAAGRLLGLDAARMAHALGLAATQPVGLRVMFGSMAKSFHPGRAAANGLQAALLAEAGFTAAEDAIEGRRGWAEILSTRFDPGQITEDLGSRFEISANTYKPFACGIVIHPVIDACLRLRGAHALAPKAVNFIELSVHPLVLELTGKTAPATGLESKFSVFHAAAVAIVRGGGGEAEFSDEAARDPGVVALRARVRASIDPTLPPDAARVALLLADGRRIEEHVDHAVGSRLRPMSDQALAEKLAALAAGLLPPSRIEKLVDLCWRIDEIADVAAIAAAARPA